MTQTPSGAPVETWSAIATKRAASVGPVSGDERFSEPQWAAKQQTEFLVRWSDSIADLSPLDRVVYPPAPAAGNIPGRTIYDVAAVHEVGRREGLRIIAVRRADG